MPDELWNEVRDIVQETGIKTIPIEKKCKKAKWQSGEALQIAVKRREAKSKGEKERYRHLNAEFQRIARRDKKAFLSDQCKEIKENNRMGKTRPFKYDLNQIPSDYTVEVRNRFKGLDLIECLMNYGWRFVTLYRRQGSRPAPRKRNARKQNGCLRRP